MILCLFVEEGEEEEEEGEEEEEVLMVRGTPNLEVAVATLSS